MSIKGFKKFIIALLIITTVFAIPFSVEGSSKYSNGVTIAAGYSSSAARKARSVERTINRRYKNTKYIEGGESMWNTIEHRKGKRCYYVTYEVGYVTSKAKDGASYYFKAPQNYISYRRVPGVKKGSKVLTYFVWCRECNECDDMIARYDVILRK